MDAMTYPARLVISRGPTRLTPAPFVCLDGVTLKDQAALGGRLLYLEDLARLGGVSVYTYTPAPEAQAETVATTIRAELERKHGLATNGAESAANTSAPEPQAGTPDKAQDTMKPQPEQVELIVAYDAGEGISPLRIVGAGELVTLKVDGQEANPPTRDLSKLYRLLAQRGYTPAGFEWLGRPVAGKRQRLQTYTRA